MQLPATVGWCTTLAALPTPRRRFESANRCPGRRAAYGIAVSASHTHTCKQIKRLDAWHAQLPRLLCGRQVAPQASAQTCYARRRTSTFGCTPQHIHVPSPTNFAPAGPKNATSSAPLLAVPYTVSTVIFTYVVACVRDTGNQSAPSAPSECRLFGFDTKKCPQDCAGFCFVFCVLCAASQVPATSLNEYRCKESLPSFTGRSVTVAFVPSLKSSRTSLFASSPARHRRVR